jgi:TonB family protein
MVLSLALLGLAAQALTAQPVPEATAPAISAAADEPLRVGGDVLRPEVISHPAPVYTPAARRARVQGVVILETVIDEQGDVTGVKVLKGLPMGLDQAAVDAVKTWKFKPATRNGTPVKVAYVLTLNFTLDESLYHGPGYNRFLAQHPDFRQALEAQRYDEAASLLARWSMETPGDPGFRLAWIYLYLERGSFGEAWQEAQSLSGAERQEAFQAFPSYVLLEAHQANPKRAAGAIDLGLKATDAALKAKPDAADLLQNKALLLREKANRMDDPAEKQRWNQEADEIETRLRTMGEGGGGK